jgi:hypothetical protein
VSGSREDLRVRRARLVERAEAERVELAQEFSRFERPLRITDRSLGIVRALRRMPMLGAAVGAGMAALAFVRPDTILDWVPGGRVIWQLLSAFVARPGQASKKS